MVNSECRTEPGTTAEGPEPSRRATGLDTRLRTTTEDVWGLRHALPLPCLLAACAMLAATAVTAENSSDIPQPHAATPPTSRLTADANTLLLLAFEEPFDPYAAFVKGHVEFVDDSRSGKALKQGAAAYVAMSAEDFLDARSGTIEVWVKFLSPGDDRVSRPIISVPGPRGLWLGKDQYGHMSFSVRRFWGRGPRVTAEGYARKWPGGVWRYVVACWSPETVQLWVDGQLLGSASARDMPDAFGPELRIGSPGLILDDLRISRTVRCRIDAPKPDDAE